MVHAGTNMRVHALSRTDGHIEDEYVSYVQSFYFLLTDALLWTKRDILDTPSLVILRMSILTMLER